MTVDLKDLKELAEAATGGNWLHVYDEQSECDTVRSEDGDFMLADDLLRRDAAFIAAANPKTVLELIARVEAAEERLETEAKVRRQAEAIVDGQSGEVFDLRSALEQAKAREAELLGALEPFAKLAEFWLERASIHGLDDEDTCATEIEFGHLRNAVTAMGGDDNG